MDFILSPLMNIISPANAQAATGGFGGFDFMSILPLVLIFAVFYFFLIRPQQKKAQQQKELLSALRRGDRIITTGGLIGVIHKVVNDQELQVEVAEGVRVRIARPMVATVLSKTEPVPDSSEDNPSTESKKPATKKVSKASKKPEK
jgi:preprotein translocase subunit YajC